MEVPDIASAYKSRMKVAAFPSSKDEVKIFESAKQQIEEAGIELKNTMEVITVHMENPSLDDTMPDNERFERAIKAQAGTERVRLPYSVMKKMSGVFRMSRFQVQAIIRKTPKDVFVYDILPMEEKAVIGGLVVDIGTTTVSALIIDMLTGEVLARVLRVMGRFDLVQMLLTELLRHRNQADMKDFRRLLLKRQLIL